MKIDYEIYPLFMDLQAKNIFGSNRNVIFTENLLENYFGLEKGKMKGCEIQNSVMLNAEILNGKEIEMDIKVKLPDGSFLNLEFYSQYDEMSEAKSFVYVTKLFGNQLSLGEKYDKLRKVKQINFVYNDYLRESNQVIRRYSVINRDDPFDFIMQNSFDIDIINLAIKDDNAYNGINKGLVDWILFMGARTKEEMIKYSKGKPILEEALKEMERFSKNEEVQGYFSRELLDASRLSYSETKRKEEIQKRKEAEKLARNKSIEIAKNLLQTTLSLEEIARSTGLSFSVVEKLANDK